MSWFSSQIWQKSTHKINKLQTEQIHLKGMRSVESVQREGIHDWSMITSAQCYAQLRVVLNHIFNLRLWKHYNEILYWLCLVICLAEIALKYHIKIRVSAFMHYFWKKFYNQDVWWKSQQSNSREKLVTVPHESLFTFLRRYN